MKVQCVHRHGDRIPDEVLATGCTPDTRFPVAYGRDYTVLGICLWRGGVLHYLVVNEENYRPDWIPAFAFQVVDGHLPSAWSFSYWRETPGFGVDAIWGYDEMVAPDAKHYVDLIEREPEALQVFERRRLEMENEISCRDETR